MITSNCVPLYIQADNASLKAQCRHLRALLANRTGVSQNGMSMTTMPGATTMCSEPRRGLVIRLPQSNKEPAGTSSPPAHQQQHKRPAATTPVMEASVRGGYAQGGSCALQQTRSIHHPRKRHVITACCPVDREEVWQCGMRWWAGVLS